MDARDPLHRLSPIRFPEAVPFDQMAARDRGGIRRRGSAGSDHGNRKSKHPGLKGTMAKPVILIIRDGWGINPSGLAGAVADGNATLLAKTPFHEHLYATYPGSVLSASGLDVGLPPGQMGNSEVGHLNLGAGRIVYQDLTRITKAIEDGELRTNPTLTKL